jgi:membrane protein
VLVVLALWASSSLQFGLARLSNYTLTNGAYKFKFFRERFMAIPSMAFSLFAISFAIIIFIQGGNLLNEFVTTVFKVPSAAELALLLRWPLALGLYLVMVIFNYYMLPRIRVPLRSIVPGAIVASLGMLLVTVVYSYYSQNFADYNIIYGSFANIVILMFWFYFISWVLLIGIMFNKAWDEILHKNRLTTKKINGYIQKQQEKVDESVSTQILDNTGISKGIDYINKMRH